MSLHFTKLFLPSLLFVFSFAAITSTDSPLLAAKSPLADAIALWHMADTKDSSGNSNELTQEGEIEFGVRLSADEAKESISRGGDGKVAKISKGDYISAGQGKEGKLNISGRKLTIYIRMKSTQPEWGFPILAKHGGHEKLAYNIYSMRDGVGCEIGTTQNRSFLSTTVKFDDMRPKGKVVESWHDLVCRVDGSRLEFFVDGRCVDEDFMLGDLKISSEPLLIGAESYNGIIKAGFDGLIDHIAIWDRSLANEEIITLSGGPDKADLRERTDRGISGESLQYWRPPNNYYVGDCMPFYHEGTFHFAYLLDKNHHQAKNGYGAHQWIQATSKDLVNWEHQPYIIPITEQWEGSICTGSLFFHDGIYYAFYATRAVRDVPAPDGNTYEGEYVGYSTSKDGIHFTKQEPNPIVKLPHDKGYSRAGRDPVVFQDERDGLFHMYITSNFNGNGCWAHLSSKDLKSWDLQKPVLAGGGDPECPDWFKWGETYYLIINWGNGFYRVSKNPTGPWEKPTAPDILMPGVPRVPKTAAFKDGRRIICGWTNENGFGGHAIFHELIRNDDGTLGEKFVPEMIPKTEKATISVKELENKEQTFEDLPNSYRLQAILEFDPAKVSSLKEWRYVFHQDASNIYALRLNPAEKTAQLGRHKIVNVDYSSGRIEIDMIVSGVVVDVSLNNTRTITETIPDMPDRDLRFTNESDDYKLKSLEISPLTTVAGKEPYLAH